jgi:hypothetical protein
VLVWHADTRERGILRQLREVDIAIGHAENFLDMVPANPLMNMRTKLTTDIPPEGSPLATYAYPENDPVDFNAGYP